MSFSFVLAILLLHLTTTQQARIFRNFAPIHCIFYPQGTQTKSQNRTYETRLSCTLPFGPTLHSQLCRCLDADKERGTASFDLCDNGPWPFTGWGMFSILDKTLGAMDIDC